VIAGKGGWHTGEGGERRGQAKKGDCGWVPGVGTVEVESGAQGGGCRG